VNPLRPLASLCVASPAPAILPACVSGSLRGSAARDPGRQCHGLPTWPAYRHRHKLLPQRPGPSGSVGGSFPRDPSARHSLTCLHVLIGNPSLTRDRMSYSMSYTSPPCFPPLPPRRYSYPLTLTTPITPHHTHHTRYRSQRVRILRSHCVKYCGRLLMYIVYIVHCACLYGGRACMLMLFILALTLFPPTYTSPHFFHSLSSCRRGSHLRWCLATSVHVHSRGRRTRAGF
jgi:hypothetical protein